MMASKRHTPEQIISKLRQEGRASQQQWRSENAPSPIAGAPPYTPNTRTARGTKMGAVAGPPAGRTIVVAARSEPNP